MFIEKCVKCKKLPRVVKVGDLYYAQCTCKKWDRYQFLGLREEYALEEWNKFNRKITRGKIIPDYDNL